MAEIADNRSWTGWVLVASLGLNLFLGGFIIARVLTPAESGDSDFRFAVAPRTLPQDLPEHVREDLEDKMRVHRLEMKRSLKALREKQKEISRLYSAEHLDSEALARAYEEMRDLNAELQGPIQEAFIAAVGEMDKEMRRAIIEIPEIRLPSEIHELGRIDGAKWQFTRDGENFEIIIGGRDDGGDDDKGELTSVFVAVETDADEDDESSEDKDKPDN